MNDIRPPRRPRPPESTGPVKTTAPPHQVTQPSNPVNTGAESSVTRMEVATSSINTNLSNTSTVGKKQKKFRSWRIVGWIIGALLLISALFAGGLFVWYHNQLEAIAPNDKQQVKVEVISGMGPNDIADLLEEKGLIKSSRAFGWYVRLEGVENNLQAGKYTLGKNMTVEEIVGHLQKGQADTFRLTFYPGAVLRDTTDTPDDKKTDVVTVLKNAGYSDAAIDAALKKQYNHPLFASKPASADLEGYVYGETYEFDTSASVEDILERSFDQMYTVIKENDLVAKFKKQGLTLYEGITLASIVQREVNGLDDQKKVAGVFYNRLKAKMTLGSDVTYQYIADKTGQSRTPDLDSPYNTRKYTGLPPGPIATPGESALLATASPITSDYLFFLSGDDDKTYFGRSQTEHERNIDQHCQKKCQIL